ncbi:hypothetical protein TSUD_58690 [Trifolium subterraneum]|uniref:Uncharacterized protein n=1 Tax=Trifolium subterraneum TaxID=3900 RepID=A0A2Z6MGY6_TRISU|nr:hypothetical protein TSUD_58690 [Trifolium subterraneum]
MVLIFVFFYIITPSEVTGVKSRKLDETTVAMTNGTDVKCGSCGDYSSPPPPVNPPPSPPPPSPKKPPTQYCPPPPSPPSPSYIYITGPPGNLYPIDENFSGASHGQHRSFAVLLLSLAVAFLGRIAF